MQIGEPLRTIVVEPLELPVNDPQTPPQPEPALRLLSRERLWLSRTLHDCIN